jgi:hypothetical protein
LSRRKKRAMLRAQDERKKANAKRRFWRLKPQILADGTVYHAPDAREVGKAAATPAACSCDMCRWPENSWKADRKAKRGEIQAQLNEL